jgi:hypothetical protein
MIINILIHLNNIYFSIPYVYHQNVSTFVEVIIQNKYYDVLQYRMRTAILFEKKKIHMPIPNGFHFLDRYMEYERSSGR